MSFVNDVNNVVEPMVGGSSDFPQRMLNESFVQQAPLAFAPTSGPSKSYKNVSQAADPEPIAEIKEEQENLSDRLDKLEAEESGKAKNAKQFFKKHHKKIKTAVLIGIAVYAGYRLFLKGRLNFGRGGFSPDPSFDSPSMESGGEITSDQI
tara:strand:+ start:325 stop:777 length:453 start_codon:yes stop_codon:yes gene_type:complete